MKKLGNLLCKANFFSSHLDFLSRKENCNGRSVTVVSISMLILCDLVGEGKMKKKLIIMLMSVAVLGLSSMCSAYISNGDFEAEDTFESWSLIATQEAPVAISDNKSAKLVPAGGGNLTQDLSTPQSAFVVDLDLAVSDPGSGRSFQLNLYHASEAGNTNMRIVQGDTSGMGTLEAFNGSNWQNVVTDAVTLSADDQNLAVNHLKIVGDYSSSPSYDVYVTDAADNTQSAMNVNAWQNTPPTAGDMLETVKFDSSNFAGGSFSVVDNISVVPEPATVALLGLGGMALIRKRRNA